MHDWEEQPYTTAKRPMRYNAPPGTRVQYAFPKNGFEIDQERARVLLTRDRTYTVTRTVDHGWHTDVYLYEVPGHAFNSVLFWEVPRARIQQKPSYSAVPPYKKAADIVRAHRCRDYIEDHFGKSCLQVIADQIERLA